MAQFVSWGPCFCVCVKYIASLQWRHNGRDIVSNHQPHDCLLKRFFRRRSKNTSKLRVTGLCAGNSPVTDEFPAQMTSNADNVSIWWRHHDNALSKNRPQPAVKYRVNFQIVSIVNFAIVFNIRNLEIRRQKDWVGHSRDLPTLVTLLFMWVEVMVNYDWSI